MERASPELFDRMVRLYNACGERPVEMCEDGIIGRAASPNFLLRHYIKPLI